MLPLQKQWDKIMETSIFTEEAILTLKGKSEKYIIKGIFSSGTYDDEKPTNGRSVRSRYVQGDYFALALSTLPENIKPYTELREALLEYRDETYKVKDIIGKDGGAITLSLIPYKNPIDVSVQGGGNA